MDSQDAGPVCSGPQTQGEKWELRAENLPPPGDILDGRNVHPSAPKQVRQKRGSSSVGILRTSPNILHITSKVSTWSKAS